MPSLPEAFPERGPLLALDISKKRIGLAGTDPSRILVTPLLTIERKGWAKDVLAIRAVCAERAVVGLVVGYPLNMDGSAGPAAQSRRDTAQRLAAELRLPVHLQDERLTTEAVRQAIDEGRLARPKRGQPVDHYAAAVILEDALKDRSRRSSTPG